MANGSGIAPLVGQRQIFATQTMEYLAFPMAIVCANLATPKAILAANVELGFIQLGIIALCVGRVKGLN